MSVMPRNCFVNTHSSVELWNQTQPVQKCKQRKTCGGYEPESSPEVK